MYTYMDTYIRYNILQYGIYIYMDRMESWNVWNIYETMDSLTWQPEKADHHPSKNGRVSHFQTNMKPLFAGVVKPSNKSSQKSLQTVLITRHHHSQMVASFLVFPHPQLTGSSPKVEMWFSLFGGNAGELGEKFRYLNQSKNLA